MTKHTSTSLGSTSGSISPDLASSPAPIPDIFDGDGLGDCLTTGGYCGREKASHRHTIICIQTHHCTRHLSIWKNIKRRDYWNS